MVKTVPVSKAALLARINRSLAKEKQVVRAARGQKAKSEVGDFFLVDVEINGLVGTNIDLEQFGRRLGVLEAWEKFEG